MKRHPALAQSKDSLLLVVDYQEKLLPSMAEREAVSQAMRRLIQGASQLNVPILVSEQYPNGLGRTSGDLQPLLDSAPVVEKVAFSCCGSEKFWGALKETKRKQIIVAGIETHICALQTALDLTANGYAVFVPIEATCSRNPAHKANALERMAKHGVEITNVESTLFEWMKKAGTDDFKAIQKLIK